MDRLAIAEISLSAYQHNLDLLRSYLKPTTKLMAVLKANAYGHGAIPLAKHAEQSGVDYLGVVCLYEAKQLRQAKITLPILILNYIDPESVQEAIDLDIAITVMDEDVLQEAVTYATKTDKKASVHVKVDSGMHRAGVSIDSAHSFIRAVAATEHILLEGIFTHFATADEDDLSFANAQLARFTSLIDQLNKEGITPPLIHAANSAATLRLPQSHFSMVRPGIATYGLSPSGKPFTDHMGNIVKLLPILTLKTRIVQIREIQKGESVGYGRTFVASKPTRVALLPIGYGDGVRRGPQRQEHVLVRGKRAPILGCISMDQTSIDVTDIPDVFIHDEVVLIGKQDPEHISADEIAGTLGTINYEVVTALSSRVTRTYIN